MRAALWIAGLFALAVGLALLGRHDPGYVVIVVPPWRLELSFLLATFTTLAAGAIALVLFRLSRATLALPGEVRDWRARRRLEATYQALRHALRDGDEARVLALLDEMERQGDRHPAIAALRDRLMLASTETP